MIVERMQGTTKSYAERSGDKLVRERKNTLTTKAVDPESQSQSNNKQDEKEENSEQLESQEAEEQHGKGAPEHSAVDSALDVVA